jgi:hypothetical protein
MREQHYQSSISNISNGRVKPTLPPTVPQDYYGTISNRLSSGKRISLFFHVLKIILSIFCINANKYIIYKTSLKFIPYSRKMFDEIIRSVKKKND